MEQTSSKVLQYRPIAAAADEIVAYIDNRRTGIIESLRTRWKKFNRLCMGGIEPNTIYSIAGKRIYASFKFLNIGES